MNRFVAYTSIAHFGFIALGVFAFSSQAFAGAVLYMFNHGITTGMLFLTIGMIIARGRSHLIEDYGGIATLAPLLAGLFLVAGLSSLALPGMNSFVSEFLILVGSFPRYPAFTVLATVGIIFAALYVLWVYQRVAQGPVRGAAVASSLAEGVNPVTGRPRLAPHENASRLRGDPAFPDLNRREIAVLAPLVVLIIGLGVYPKPMLDVITPSVQATMTEVGLTDPVAAQPAQPGGK
jgi:NADH-quinone oxidoreductase subunit M